jgi:hypothetical protein
MSWSAEKKPRGVEGVGLLRAAARHRADPPDAAVAMDARRAPRVTIARKARCAPGADPAPIRTGACLATAATKVVGRPRRCRNGLRCKWASWVPRSACYRGAGARRPALMLHVGLDLTRRRLSVCLLDEGARLQIAVAARCGGRARPRRPARGAARAGRDRVDERRAARARHVGGVRRSASRAVPSSLRPLRSPYACSSRPRGACVRDQGAFRTPGGRACVRRELI